MLIENQMKIENLLMTHLHIIKKMPIEEIYKRFRIDFDLKSLQQCQQIIEETITHLKTYN